MTTDFLVIGSGIAGYSYAIKVAECNPENRIIVVTKDNPNESNSNYAQGGIAVVTNYSKDSTAQHIQDTLTAGDGLCDKMVVETVIEEGSERLKELVHWGAQFDKDKEGGFSLENEGGHSEHRVVHHKDMTGREIMRALRTKVNELANIELLPYHTAIDLITINDKVSCCQGAIVFDNKNKETFPILANTTILASGGAGQVYSFTTNPDIATGDGIAMAKRVGAEIEDMEFIQFHPTALYHPDNHPVFLISEAVRGFGAILKNSNEEAFMHKYDPRKDLASRDIVARAIYTELEKNDASNVFLDCRHIESDAFKSHFPSINAKCLELGIDTSKDMIPVAPAAHYVCGGIKVDLHGQTSIQNLYAIGECSRTGLHGANRLASNSLLEAIVFAHRAYKNSIKKTILKFSTSANQREYKKTSLNEDVVDSLRLQLQVLMSNKVGIIRSSSELLEAKSKVQQFKQQLNDNIDPNDVSSKSISLRNLIEVADLIIEQSLKRNKNKGGFYNVDYS